ncbi:MAG: bifunctional hydroxymethylpyrimidine kinase/phosphomethylpyrimidine kinase [Prevotella sp.]
MKQYIPVLTIAGSDSSGGAGIQADIKTISALGCYAASAITSITVQNTLGVTAVQAVEPEIVAGQIRAVMDDIKPKAVKIGMVNDKATISSIASALHDYAIDNLVVDTVMVATAGSRLMKEDALDAFRRELMPMATILTPNITEAEVLSGLKIKAAADAGASPKELKAIVDEAARIILESGCKSVLIKGGHLSGDKIDRLYGCETHEYRCREVETTNTHGTGCTLSAAIAAFLAHGHSMTEAVEHAKDYVTRALRAGADVHIGEGAGPVNHFFSPERQRIMFI